MRIPERTVVAVNPEATAASKLAPQVVDDLSEAFGRANVAVEKTVSGRLKDNQEHFASILRPGDVVVAVTGDGGFRLIGAALLHPDMADVRDSIELTTVGGGEASDMSKTLHGKWMPQPSRLVQEGEVRASRPLRFTIEPNNVRPAFSYIGVGKSAEGAAIVNSGDYRHQPRWRREPALLGQLMASHTAFRPEFMGRHPDEYPEVLSELSVIIGSNMAKYGRVDARPWEPMAWVMAVEPGKLHTAIGLARLAVGKPVGNYDSRPVQFSVSRSVSAHCDGEPFYVPDRSTVTIDRYPTPVNLLVSKGVIMPDYDGIAL
jgi:diacylglycerol kinase family enzyme